MAPKPPSSSGKTKTKPNFKWTPAILKEFLDSCVEYKKRNGLSQGYVWVDVLEILEEKTGVKVEVSCARNKFDNMKATWKTWNELKNGQTGLGWDPETNNVVADDDWWETKKKENSKFMQFRHKGISPEREAIWDEVFGGIVAQGQYCVAANMEAPIDIDEGSEDLGDELESGRPVGDKGVESDFDMHNWMNCDLDSEDPTTFDGLYEAVGKSQSRKRKVNNSGVGTEVKASKSSVGGSALKGKARRRKGSVGAQMFSDHLAMVDATSQRMLSLLEGESTSRVDQTPKTSTIEVAMTLLGEMVKENLLKEGSTIWCFAVSEFREEFSRGMFCLIPTHSARYKWLEFEFTKTDKGE